MLRILAKWSARKYYIFSQEFQAKTADLHAGLSLRLAGEKRALIERPMPELHSPVWELQFAATGNRPAFLRDEPFVIFAKG